MDLGCKVCRKQMQNFELQSSSMSGLIFKVEVICIKCNKMLSNWKPCSDNYMHLFDIPAKIGESLDVAFQALVLPVKMPTEDAVLKGDQRVKLGLIT